MDLDICSHLDKFDEQTKQRFNALYGLIYESTSQIINEKLWAKIPSFYVRILSFLFLLKMILILKQKRFFLIFMN